MASYRPQACTIISSAVHIIIHAASSVDECALELGRYRFLKSGFGFLVGFLKVGIGIGFSKYRFRFSVFPHEPTIAYRITPSLTPYALPFPPNGVWALEFALQVAAIRDSDIVTIDNL